MRILDVPPPIALRTVRAWDLASTTSGDWTGGLKLSHYTTAGDGNAWIITDVRRMRGRPDEVRALFAEVVRTDGHVVARSLPQDLGQAGVDQAQSYVRSMPGYQIECERTS
jgi:phage terminase large subunit-like protein